MENTATFPWSPTQKLVFRFFFVLFLLYIFFNPNGVLPYSDDLYNFYIPPFHKLMIWIAKNILHLSYPVTVFTNGSGDTTYDYVVVFFITIVAISASVVWSILDRRTKTYNKLFYWLCVVIRYYLAITMFAYGFVKVFKLQFPFPSPSLIRALRKFFTYGTCMEFPWFFPGL